MKKADLVQAITDKTGLSAAECSRIIETIFEIIKTSLVTHGQIKIAGFGVFTVKQTSVRRGRNPQTGDAMQLSARKVLKFKASPALKKEMST